MTYNRRMTPLLVAALLAAPAWAGDDDYDHKKCTAEAGVCIAKMVEGLSQRGWIGIEWDSEDERPVLSQVVAGSPAEASGLEKGDVLLAFNGVDTSAGEEAVWAEAKKSLVPDNTITLTILRSGVKKDVEVTLVPLPRHVMALWVGNHVIEHHVAVKDDEADEGDEADEAAKSPRP